MPAEIEQWEALVAEFKAAQKAGNQQALAEIGERAYSVYLAVRMAGNDDDSLDDDLEAIQRATGTTPKRPF